MRKKIWVILLILCIALTPAMGLAASTLRVQGSATVNVAPDRAVVSVGYTGESPDPSFAQQQTAEAVEKIVTAVTKLGVMTEDIATTYINMYPVYNYTEGTSQVRGYSVEHMVAITVKDIEQVGAVLDAALAAGANQTGGISYVSSREHDVYLQALGLAVENAVSKADALAIASGVWLGGLDQINELSTSVSPYVREASVAYDKASGTTLGGSLMTGDIKVEASVELVYEIR